MGKKSQTTHLIEAFHRDWDDVQVGRQCLWWLSRPFEEVFSFLVFPSVVLWVENKEFVGVECLPLLYNWLKVKLRKRKQSLIHSQLKFRLVMFTAENSPTSNASSVASRQRKSTQRAWEAIDVKNQITRSHHKVRRSNSSSATRTTSNGKYSRKETRRKIFTVRWNVLEKFNRSRQMSPAQQPRQSSDKHRN